MFAYVVKRLLSGFVVVVLISISVFALFFFGPSKPAQPICDRDTSNRCGNRIELYQESLGYNNPFWSEYAKYAKGVVVGREITIGPRTYQCDAPCLGYTFTTKVPVWEELKERLPATISIAVGGAFLYVLFGVPIGVAAARRRGTTADKALVSSFLILSSVPYYLFALLLYLYTNVILEVPVLSTAEYTPLTDNPAKWFAGLLLPWIALGIFGCTQYTRYSRGAMVEALSEDYIRTAKAKGLPPRTVVYKHGLRSAMVPIVTIFGIDFGALLAGTIFTERIFEIQGIGWWGLQAVGDKDLPVVAATALFGSIVIIISNIVVDVVYGVLDPRVRIS